MAKSPKKPKPAAPRPGARLDLNQIAARIVAEATGRAEKTPAPPEKNAAAVALGAKGGTARAKSMGKKKRSDSAKKAAKMRWVAHQ